MYFATPPHSTITPLTRKRRDSVWSKSRTILFDDRRFACASRSQGRSHRKKLKKKKKKIARIREKGAKRDVGTRSKKITAEEEREKEREGDKERKRTQPVLAARKREPN